MPNQKDLLTHAIIGCAIDVHRALGPGLLESAYEECLEYELLQHRFSIERQLAIPVRYKGVILDCGYRLDLLVEDKVIVEVKSVESLLPVHEAQLFTYLRFANRRVGLLMNFNVPSLRQGLKRFIL